jgi:hypothetical protein
MSEFLAQDAPQETTVEISNASTEITQPQSSPDSSKTESSYILQQPPVWDAVDKKHYHRIGFTCAISQIESPEKELQLLIEKHKAQIKELLNQLQTIYTLESANITRQTDELNQLIASEEVKILTAHLDAEQLKKQEEELKNNLLQLETELSLVYKDFGQRKEMMVENRIEEVRNELTKIINNYQTICENRTKINTSEYEVNKNAIEKRIRILETFIERNKKAYEALSAKLLPLSERGIGEKGVNVMISFAFSAAIGAGWFFSIYALNERFDNKDGIGFVLEGIFQFGGRMMASAGNPVWGGFLLIAALLAFITVTGGVAWLAQKIIDHYNSSSTNIKIDFETDEYMRFLLRTKITATNFISFWMQLSPYVFIGGVLYVLLIMGNSGNKISEVSTSLSAQTVGAFFALLTSGVSLLYIMKVIEPRVEAQGNSKNVWIRSNIELAVVIGLFIVFVVLLITGISSRNAAVPIAGFAVMTLLTGVLMGYALRYKTLISQVKDLEFQTERFAIEVQKLSRPKPLFIEYDEGKLFNRKFIELEKELMELSILKSKQVAQLWQGQPQKRVNRKGYWVRMWQKYVAGDNNIMFYDDDAYYNLSAGEERLFPSVSTRIEEVKQKIVKVKTELAQTTSQITDIREETSNYLLRLRNNIKESRKRIDDLQQKLIDFRVDFHKKSEVLQLLKEHQEYGIKDGFDVGMWYRLNQLGPLPNYYNSKTIQHTASDE